MCYTEEDIARFLALPYQRLTANDLRPIFWDAYVCWGTWPQVAYYVPRLLELYAEDALVGFDDNLFAKLLLAVRPELAGKIVPELGELMSQEERHSVFEFVQAVLETRLPEKAERDQVYVLTEALSFLAAFDTPIEPLLNTLHQSKLSVVRANVCVFMATYIGQVPEFGNDWLDNYSLLPENEAVLTAFLAPASVAAYLLAHIEDVQRFDAATREQVNYAFDWTVSQLSDGT